MFSPMDIGILAGVALLVFGPKKFPELGHSLGKGIGNFKKAMSEVSDEVSTAIKTEPEKPTTSHLAPVAYHGPGSAQAMAPDTTSPQPAPTLAQTAAPAPAPEPHTPESPPDKAI
jgi:TatA/E family protein of Tat protein translocase